MKKLLSVFMALCFIIGAAACSFTGGSDRPSASPDQSGRPAGESSAEPLPSTTPHTIKSADDEAFEALSSEIFTSVVTADGFTFHQFVKDPASFGIEESEIERGWGEISLEAHERDYRENDELIAKMKGIDKANLNPLNSVAYDTLMETLELAELSKDYYYYGEPLETLNGSHTMLPLMMTMFEISSKDDLDSYMLLLEDMPRYMDQIAVFEREKAEKGLFMTENALDTVLGSIDTFALSGESCFLIAHLDEVLEGGVEGVSADEAGEYSNRSRECVLNGIIPAYKRLKSTLEGLRSKCGPFVGAAERGEEARAHFIASIRSGAACMAEPEEMAELLSETVSTLISKLVQIMYSDRDAVNTLGKTITSGDADTDIAYLLELIADIYPRIPAQRITYVTVPEAVAEDFSPAAYLISAFDDPTRNIVIKNPTADTRTLLFTMAHECYPGHLYQTQYFRSGGFPLAQQVAAPSGYSEGWAVFSELMMASRAERYGANACLLDQYNSIASNILIPAYVSLRVNCDGWDKVRIGKFLQDFGLNDEAYIDIIYEYAVNMPDYFFNYAMGFANTYKIYQFVSPKTDDELKTFLSDYLGMGPCCFDVLFERFGIKN